MISVTSVTDKYILQPTLISKHKKTLEWLSAAVLWKIELSFFQKLLDQAAPKFSNSEEKKQIDHFQNIIIYYKGELIDSLTSRLRLHEKNLADLLQSHDETKVQYFKEHDTLMNEFESLNNQFAEYKTNLYVFVEKVL
jgi:hypothetical protein